MQVVALVKEGKTAREIADALGCSPQYVGTTARRQGISLAPGRRSRVTEQEIGVTRLVAQGLGNKEIALRLGVSESTVKVHVKAILRVTKLQNRTQLALWAVAKGIASNPYAERADA